jgi:transposase InsO family protein
VQDLALAYDRMTMRQRLEVIQAIPSMSGVGNCDDNAKAEAFFSSLKTECFPVSNCFESKAQARSAIFEYIEVYYNNQRLHSALGYQSSRQYESRSRLISELKMKRIRFWNKCSRRSAQAVAGSDRKRVNGLHSIRQRSP